MNSSLKYKTVTIMKESENTQNVVTQALNISVVVHSAFLNVKEAQIHFSIACKKYIESKPHQYMINALKCAGAF